MDHILELQEVSKAYRRSDFKLDKVSFRLPYGAIMGFVGENGAGKTTTIDCILNTIGKDEGNILLFGKEMKDEDKELRENIGVVYDGDNFPGYLNPMQLSDIMGGLYKQWDNGMFLDYLKRFRLPEKKKIKTYSRGMTMKLAIAAALAHHPKLLILDEATSGLDPVMREEILEVFLEFIEEEAHSILLSSHITSDLEKIADYITFIHEGRIILTASKNELAYEYGIVRCKESQFKEIDKEDVVAYRKRDFQTDVLTADTKKAERKYRDVVIDRVSIDEIMVMLVKGERL